MSARAHNAERELASRFDMLPQRVRQALIGDEDQGRVVALCVEPGMGRSALVQDVMLYWSGRGLRVERLNLRGETSATAGVAMEELSKTVIEHAPEEGHPVVLVEGVPVPDECDVDQQAEALQGMARAGCLVLVSLLPEAEQLVEELAFVTRIGADDLLRPLPAGRDRMMGDLTHGIPALVDTLGQHDEGVSSAAGRPSLPNDYRNALSLLVSSCVRSTLPVEDCRIRLAMLLLGAGTTDDVVAVSDKLDADTWSWMEREAPLFGIDGFAETFSCAGLSTLEGLRGCRMALRVACERMPDVVVRATRVLAARGDTKRAAVTCGMCQPSDSMDLAREWGVELICAGEDALVLKALERHAEQGATETESSEMAALALSSLSDPATRIRVRALPPLGSYRGPSALHRRRRYTELLQACRDLDRGIEPGRVALAHDDDDEVACALVDHLHARGLLLSGEFARAYALLVDNAMRQHPDTLVAAMLCDDYEIARTLIGEAQSAQDRHAAAMADETFEHLQTDRLRCYHRVLGEVLATLVARYEGAGFAEPISRAEKMGDQAIRAALLVAAAVADVRKGAYASAHVHALYVTELAGGPASDYMVLAARLVDALVQAHLKDEVGLHELARTACPSPVSDMALLATAGEHGDGVGVRLRALSSSSQPKDELWMLNVVLNDFDGDGLSQRFRQNAPKAWASLSRGVVRRAEKRLRAKERPMPVVPVAPGTQPVLPVPNGPTGLRDVGSRGTRVGLHVLGGVKVTLDGIDIAPQLGRRRVKSYLLLLAAARGHELGMYEVMDSLWPGIDLMAGRQRVYSANSELRRILKQRGSDVDLIAKSRGEGTIRLDPSVVSVDVDEFERLADGALRAVGDDELVLRLAIEAASHYPGDVASSSYDSHGLIARRRHDLRELYVDVAVAGSRSALGEGKVPQAVRLAKGAHGANDMREDVIAALIRALRAAGRDADACMAYDAYARQLLTREGRPPAPAIRRLIDDVYRSPHSGAVVVGQTERHEDLLLI